MPLMKTWTKVTPSFIDTRWFTVLLSFLVVLLSGLAGGLVAGVTWSLAGKEIFILSVLLGSWLVLFLSAVKFDFMILVTFCLFSLVQIEPAPTDMLVMLLLLVGLLTGKLSLMALTGSSLIHLALWGFLVANLTSLVYVNEILAGLRYLFITAYMIFLTYFVKMYITSYQAMRTVVIGYLVSALLAVFLVALGYLGIGTELFITRYGTRAQGPFKDANVFGPFLILMIVFLIDEILHPLIFRGLYPAKAFGLIVLTMGVFVSGSRAAWGNLALSLLIYFILTIKSTPRARIIHLISLLRAKIGYLLILLTVGLLVLVALLTQLDSPEFIQAFLSERAKFQIYDITRFAMQIEGINAGFTHLIGVGPGMWVDAHSLYVRAFAEHGIFGLAALLLFTLVLSTGTFSRAIREPVKPYGLSAKVVFACLVGHIMNSIVIDTIHWRHFWFLLALAWVVITAKLETVAPSYLEGNGGER
jgi:hypothetical protein